MKRICIYCEKWASGGIESFLASMLSKMNLSHFQIDIVASQIEESIFTVPLQELGISFYQLSGNRNLVFQNQKNFIKLLQQKHYDILHVNAFHAASFYFLHLGSALGVPKRIAHAHNSNLRHGTFRALKLAVHTQAKQHFVKDATDLWACSSTAAQFMFPPAYHACHRVHIIPNGIDTARFSFQADQRIKIRQGLHINDYFVIGNVGRLSEQKNQLFLIKVLKELIQFIPNSRLLLVGDGELAVYLKEEAAALGLADYVLFVGITDHVEELLWAMDMFLFPSLFEGLGIAVVEAQASGLPVLCSDNVPQEALLLPTACSLSLDKGEKAWALKALSLCQRTIHREKCAEMVQAKGFDMKDVAQEIALLYQAEPSTGGRT